MFQEFLEKHNISAKKIAVGVSGGADSLAAVLMLKHELSKKNIKIIALTVDHGLRPSSADEATYVKETMQKYGIEHHTLVWKGKKPLTGVEEAAREARYNLIENWCQKNNVKYFITAHHLYDQAETFFMRLSRGSGLDGLCGMKEQSQRKSLIILRPFLNTDPETFKTYLTKHNLQWIEDESNKDESLLRVRIRNFLPLLKQKTGITPSQIVQTMSRLQSSKDYLSSKVQNSIQNNFKKWTEQAFSCPSDFLKKQPDEMQYRLIAFLLKTIADTPYPPEAEKIFKLMKKMNLQTFKSATLGHCQIIKKDNQFWFLPEKIKTDSYTQKLWKEYAKEHRLQTKKLPSALKPLLLSSL